MRSDSDEDQGGSEGQGGSTAGKTAGKTVGNTTSTDDELTCVQDRLLANNTAAGKWSLDVRQGTLDLDLGAARVFGLADAGTLRIEEFLPLVLPECRGRWLHAVDISCSTDTRLVETVNISSPGTSAGQICMLADPVGDKPAERLLAGIMFDPDVGTASRNQKAADRLADFEEMAEEWLWEMDAQLRFTYFSQGSRVEPGFLNGPLNKTRGETLSPKSEQLEMDMHLAWLAQHKPFRDFRYWSRAPDGSDKYLSTSGKPLFDRFGTFLGYRGTARDLTDQQEIREALLLANRQLNTANKAKSDALTSLKEAHALLEDQNSELARVQEEVEHKAMHDPLTGVANRRFLDMQLADSAERCRDANDWLGVLHIDLDRFKQINDTLGHAAGDAVLAHVAEVLETTAGPEHFVARVGGDEFVMVHTGGADQAELGVLAQSLIEQLGKPFFYEDRECWFGASVGIAAMRGSEIVSDELLMNADIALYRAKHRGRGCFQYYSDEVQRELMRHKEVADGIRAGLRRAEFRPWYQPQVDARTWQITGFEALARWHAPDGSVRSPADFLPVAEELSIVPTIDRQILECALSDMRLWDEMNLPQLTTSVNVSARRLLDPDLRSSLAEMNIPPGRMAFELLESVFLDDMNETLVWNVDGLKEMGIDVQLDDFGSGHASIISLVKLGPDAIKIDRQITAAVTLDDTRRAIAGSIIGIGQTLGVQVVGEGVENQEQAVMLAEMGCDLLQGYLFSRPMPADMVPDFITGWDEQLTRLRKMAS